MDWSGAGEVSPEAHGNRKFAPTILEDICATSHGAGEGRSLGSNHKSQIQKKKNMKSVLLRRARHKPRRRRHTRMQEESASSCESDL